MVAKIGRKIKLYGELVMFSHSLFALPFGLAGMILAANGLPPWRTFFWIMVCLLGARNAANALNRVIDREIDAKNPRTAQRHIPQGLVTIGEALVLTGLGFFLLLVGAWQLNPLCFKLAPLAVFILVIYSYTKRWTWLCHLVLGFACGIAPTASWIAVTGQFALPPLILSAAVMAWVAGFDIIYATQDIDFDRREGIFSIPAKFGLENSLKISALLHAITLILLLLLPLTLAPPYATLGGCYYLGVILIAGLLVGEHLLVRPHDLKRVTTAAYTVNQIIGPVLLLFILMEVYLGKGGNI
ncbi:MAG TPA: 4-hydroxybenzoate octaprenyltransferase [Moorella mulderi]|nr:4-hydroxybenzoate octaprenyltransferase [Moorella mulderi]